MKTNPLKQGIITEHSTGIGTVNRGMVRARAVELAIINGRSAAEVGKSDWDQALQEMTGESVNDPVVEVLEAAPESERWDPLPGSPGHQAPTAPSADEDAEGRSDNERLVEAGIDEAGHDQMLQAARAAIRQGS